MEVDSPKENLCSKYNLQFVLLAINSIGSHWSVSCGATGDAFRCSHHSMGNLADISELEITYFG